MKTEARIQQFIAAGAGVTFYTNPRSEPLAAAHLVNMRDPDFAGDLSRAPMVPALWFCTLWPENEFAQHWRPFSQVEDRGSGAGTAGVLVFKDAKGNALFDLGALDPDELDACQWARWQKEDDKEAREGHVFVRALEVGIVNSVISNQ